jgi:hypothetical protein
LLSGSDKEVADIEVEDVDVEFELVAVCDMLGSFCIIISRPRIWSLRLPFPLPVSAVSLSVEETTVEDVEEVPVLAELVADVALSSWLSMAARS